MQKRKRSKAGGVESLGTRLTKCTMENFHTNIPTPKWFDRMAEGTIGLNPGCIQYGTNSTQLDGSSFVNRYCRGNGSTGMGISYNTGLEGIVIAGLLH